MLEIIAPLMPDYTINIPEDPAALIAWLVLFGLMVILIIRTKQGDGMMNRSHLIWMAALSLLILVLTPFLGISVNLEPDSHFDQQPALHLMFFAAVPWMVGGGILGVLPASLLAGMSGLLFSYLETHHIFTPLVFICMAVVFTWGVRQRYRTTFYKFLRIPIFSSLLAIIAVSPVLFLAEIFTVSGTFPLRVVTAVNRMPEQLVIYGGMLLIGGVVCILVAAIFPERWGSSTPLSPAPAEKHLKSRFIVKIIPLILIVLLLLFGFLWRLNIDSARREIVDELVNISELASQGWRVFVDTGLTALENLEDEMLSSGPETLDDGTIALNIKEDAFFDQIAVISPQGEIIASGGRDAESAPLVIPEEIISASLELVNNNFKIMMASESEDETQTFIHFLQAISNETGQKDHVLLGSINLFENNFSRILVTAFKPLEKYQGFGQIINKSGEILFSIGGTESDVSFSGTVYSTPTYYETPLTDGGFLMKYFYPVDGTEWAVVTSASGAAVYQNAWQQSWPIFVFGMSIFAVFLLFVLSSFSSILDDIQTLDADMEKLAKGNFDVGLSEASSKGEVSQLFDRFNQLAGSLTARLRKQDDLISLSDQISSKNNLEDSLKSIMNAALNSGADSIRIIIDNTFGLNQPSIGQKIFSLGKEADLFAHLDSEIKNLVRSQGELILYDYQITKKITSINPQAYPSALIAVPLHWEGNEIGVLWTAYQNENSTLDGDIQYIRDLAQKTSTVLARARVLGNALGLKKYMERLLDVLRDGILLINETNRVIYYNQSAQSLLGLSPTEVNDSTIPLLITNASLAEFISKADQNFEPRDFIMEDDTICRVSVSKVDDNVEGIVRAVLLQDITQTKKKEMVKSEFVTTASHELQSPLTLIHGYAKLLRLTGNLNDQQDTYINNIIEGVEDMKKLVQNLLDVGRLESGEILEINRISATELAKKVYERMQPFAKQRNIHLELLKTGSNIALDADEVFLSQALKNLIENAIKFTKMGGNVTLAVRDMEDKVVFVVKDNGIGIAPLDQRHLFEKFKHRSLSLGQESKGSGLGLAIVKSIAERHGGKIWFESQLAQGSTFYLEIPKTYGKTL